VAAVEEEEVAVCLVAEVMGTSLPVLYSVTFLVEAVEVVALVADQVAVVEDLEDLVVAVSAVVAQVEVGKFLK
jgi:hypothetical protein